MVKKSATKKYNYLYIILVVVFVLIILGVLIYGYFSITGNAIFGGRISNRCVDSDNTIVQKDDASYFTKGYVEVKRIFRTIKRDDVCVSKNNLLEGYCDKNKNPRNIFIKCKDGCSDGSCVEINKNKVLVIIDVNDYFQLENNLLEFKKDVENKFDVIVELYPVEDLTTTSPNKIRQILISECSLDIVEGCKNLEGAIFVGDVPYEIFDIPYENQGELVAPFMFYYQDLDATFKKNSEGNYFDYSSFGEHHGPEIYISWIRASKDLDFGDEIEQLKKYFNKHHQYFTGEMKISKSGIWGVHVPGQFEHNEILTYLYGLYGENNVKFFEPEEVNVLSPLHEALFSEFENVPEIAFLHSHGSPSSLFGFNPHQLKELNGLPIFLYSGPACSVGNFYNFEGNSIPLNFINSETGGLVYFGNLHNGISSEEVGFMGRNLVHDILRYWSEGDYLGKIMLRHQENIGNFDDGRWVDSQNNIELPASFYEMSGPLQQIIIGSPFIYSKRAEEIDFSCFEIGDSSFCKEFY